VRWNEYLREREFWYVGNSCFYVLWWLVCWRFSFFYWWSRYPKEGVKGLEGGGAAIEAVVFVELWDSNWRLYSVTVGYNQRESCIDNTQLSSCINSNDYKQIMQWIRNHSLTHCFSSLFLSSLFFSANLLITSTIFSVSSRHMVSEPYH